MNRLSEALDITAPVPLDSVPEFLLRLWNVYSFFVLYARLESFDPSRAKPAAGDLSVLDRWVLARATISCRQPSTR